MSKYFFSLFLSALTPLCASAQWTAAAYIGKVHTANADIHVTGGPSTDVIFKNVGFDDRSFDGPLYQGLRGTYMFTPWASVEGEYIHIKAFARVNELVAASGHVPGLGNVTTTVAPVLVLQQYSVSHGLNLMLGNSVLRHDLTQR